MDLYSEMGASLFDLEKYLLEPIRERRAIQFGNWI